MLNLTRSGSIADVIAEARSVPARVIPYAAAAALTRCAVAGQAEVKRVMPEVFKGPTRYTLNALRVVPATKDKLLASVAVKDQAGQGATRPESYLLPGVEGGKRKEKRFEKALRYAGILGKNQYAMPGDSISLDTFGNVSASQIKTILALAKRQGRRPVKHSDTKGRRIRLTSNSDIFVGVPTSGSGAGRRRRPGAASGIYRREGHRIRPLFIFTSNTPDYRPRLDFDRVVSGVVRVRFAAEFERAAQDILSHPRK
jgi:hypothetical protein